MPIVGAKIKDEVLDPKPSRGSTFVMNFKSIRSTFWIAAGTLLFSALLLPPPSVQAGAEPVCSGLSLLSSMSSLRSSDALRVQHTRNEVRVIDTASKAPLFIATCRAVSRHGEATRTERPAPATPSRTVVRRTSRGERVFSHSVTATGARVTVVAKGFLMAHAVHLTTFDNDDVHVSDGTGALIHSVTTRPDGTLVEREGKRYGCGCERVTHPDGRTERRSLP